MYIIIFVLERTVLPLIVTVINFLRRTGSGFFYPKTIPGPRRRHFMSLSPIGSAVFELLSRKHTDRQTDIILLYTQGGIGHIISQRSLLKCHISEESSFYVDSRNISFENIFVSSHSSEWSKNYPAMRKKSLSIPKMYF